MLAQTTLRNILGTRTLSGILSEREEIAEEMLKILDEATDPWGKLFYFDFEESANYITVIIES